MNTLKFYKIWKAFLSCIITKLQDDNVEKEEQHSENSLHQLIIQEI
jgi:hypothetical protein